MIRLAPPLTTSAPAIVWLQLASGRLAAQRPSMLLLCVAFPYVDVDWVEATLDKLP